jgi:asparagine synthase (glutamine-hydrolysing)
MCGIAGFYRFNSAEVDPSAEHVALQQIATMRYRGPDAVGSFSGPGVAFAHARLSIIDVSTTANQPMTDSSGNLTIIFNGEIYNFQQIRAELEKRGHRFRTRSDTEVILEGYKAWGDDVVQKLRGMFAVALFDHTRDRLLLVRDRIGKKPLYYATIDGALVFASEIKGILRYPGASRQTDYGAIHEYLTFQYVPSPMTAFVGIHKLPPAHLAVVHRNGRVDVKRYFHLPPPSATKRQPIAALREQLIEQLKESTRLRMISDVPLGAFLSGGVDSSAVVAMMAQVSNDPVRTFTIGFDEQTYDERQYARMVASRYGTQHTEMTVRPDALSVLPALVYHYGEPYADSSAIPTYYVSKIAREHVTVILSGDGGDENFLGYTRYLNCRTHDKISRLPRPLLRQLRKMAWAIPKGLDRFTLARRIRNLGTRLYQRRSRRYEQFIAYFSDESKNEIYTGDMRKHLAHSSLDRLDEYFDQARSMALGAAWADSHTYLPDDLLVKVDVASMANSLEVRAPFLDHELMTWAAGIAEEQRFQGRELKALLKQAMEPYLPKELMYRPKMGFGVPIDIWLRNEMREFAYDTLLSETARARGLFDANVVRTLLDRHSAGENWSIRIWALLMLELWFRMWIDTSDPFETDVAKQIISRYSVNGREAA